MSQPRPGSPEAAAVVWSPLPEDDAPGRAAEARRARRRGLLQAAVGAAMGGLLYGLWSPVVATVVFSISGLILLCSQLSPQRAYGAIERVFAALGHWTGEALTVVTMTLLFYLVFLPFRLLFRRGTRDAMKRYYEPGLDSYWLDREPAASGSHLRQY